MAGKRIFGVTAEQEQRQDELLRDVRTPLARLYGGLMTREGSCGLSAVTVGLLFFFPAVWFFTLSLFCLLYYLRWSKTREDALPMRMPGVYDGIDYGGEVVRCVGL